MARELVRADRRAGRGHRDRRRRSALDPEIEVTLLRTAQEALANVAKHAHAGRARLTLSFMGDVVALDVRDDGVGFDVERPVRTPGGGFGLHGMRQRVARVAGRW